MNGEGSCGRLVGSRKGFIREDGLEVIILVGVVKVVCSTDKMGGNDEVDGELQEFCKAVLNDDFGGGYRYNSRVIHVLGQVGEGGDGRVGAEDPGSCGAGNLGPAILLESVVEMSFEEDAGARDSLDCTLNDP